VRRQAPRRTRVVTNDHESSIAKHAHPFLSREQQGVLTQALVSHNATTVQGVTPSTVLRTADGFINGFYE
jgi:hypothetical protein